MNKKKWINRISTLTLASTMITNFVLPIGVSYAGTTINSSISSSSQNYSATSGGENAILVTDGTSTLKKITLSKTGDETGDDSDFYGTNAGILVKGGTLNIEDSDISTDGSHANAVFAYSNGTINISNTTIKTSKNNSGGVMVTGGGTINANNLTVTTDGNSSAPIRSDRGGGTLTVNGGTYTANGVGSPAIYSTADIIVSDATLISTVSDGVVVEGKNTITLNNVTLTDNNTKTNGKSNTYKNIFLYQSMSKDAEVGTAKFISKDSTITTNNGDTIYVTNTTAVVNLENNTFITNSDGGFLRAEAGAWGSTGSNGGKVTLIANNQKLEGDIFIDNISTLNMALRSGSTYEGTINTANTAKTLSLSISKDSKIKLTGDSYVTSLADEDTTLSNIDFNGHTLYVNGNAITESSKTDSVLETYKSEVDMPSEESSTSTSGGKMDNDGTSPTKPNDDGKEPPAKPEGEGKEPPTRPSGENGKEPPVKPSGDKNPTSKIKWEKASDWATEELNKANEMDIIPEIFNEQDLTTNITRKEFAHVAVKLWEKISCQTVAPGPKDPFTDTHDTEVLKAYNLEITKGTSETTFEPDKLITREEMATMMTRAISKAGLDTSVDLEKVAKFDDDNEMHDWGRASIYYMSNIEIIKGMGDNKFGVLGNATREQSLLISERSVEKFGK